MTEISIWDKGRPHLLAEFASPAGGNDQLALAATALDALFAVAEHLFEPLAVDIRIACGDAETGYPLDGPLPATPFHQLRLAAVPDQVAVEEIWENTRVARCDRLGRDEILEWIGTILAARECAEVQATTVWAQLVIEAVRARLPEAVANDARTIRTYYGAGEIDYPVERAAGAAWVASPLVGTGLDAVPFEVEMTNDAGYLTLDLTLSWSPWADPEGAGRPDIEAAVARLAALGWTVTSPFDR